MTPRQLVDVASQLDVEMIHVGELIEFVKQHTDADPRVIRQAIYETYPVGQTGRVFL